MAFIGLAAAQRLAGMPVANLLAAALWIAFSGAVFYQFFLWIAVPARDAARCQRGFNNLIIFQPAAMPGG